MITYIIALAIGILLLVMVSIVSQLEEEAGEPDERKPNTIWATVVSLIIIILLGAVVDMAEKDSYLEGHQDALNGENKYEIKIDTSYVKK